MGKNRILAVWIAGVALVIVAFFLTLNACRNSSTSTVSVSSVSGSRSAGEHTASGIMVARDSSHQEPLIPGHLDNSRSYTVVLGTRERSDEFKRVPAYIAIGAGAQIRALATGDTTSTIRQLVDEGYVPYDYLPADVDLDLVVPECSGKLALWPDQSLGEDIGTPEWLLVQRALILRCFYRWYYRPSLQPKAAYQEIQVDNLKPIAAFWINPVTGGGFKVGTKKGDLEIRRINQLDSYTHWSSYKDSFQIVLIRTDDSQAQPSTGKLDTPESPLPEDSKTASTPKCCRLEAEDIPFTSDEEFEMWFDCDCDHDQVCVVVASYTTDWLVRDWFIVESNVDCGTSSGATMYVPCDSPFVSKEIVGEGSPATEIGCSCTQMTPPPVCPEETDSCVTRSGALCWALHHPYYDPNTDWYHSPCSYSVCRCGGGKSSSGSCCGPKT